MNRTDDPNPAPLDLSAYRLVEMPRALHPLPGQVWLLDADGRPTYYAYLNHGFAVAEVTYSRLADALGLACCPAVYGTGLQHEGASEFISATRIEPGYIPARLWLRKRKPLRNPEDRLLHAGLGQLVANLWAEDYEGYVRSDGYWMKANNGEAFFSLGLWAEMQRRNSGMLRPPGPAKAAWFLEITEEAPAARAVCPRLAGLSDGALEACLAAPDWRDVTAVRDHLLERLLWARAVARKVTEEALD